jgi:RNA polymerase sigma-70 factor (ECF subfamily)
MLRSVSTVSPSPAADEQLLEAARGGDEGAFQSLVEPRRGELHAHCYRMLGSVHDAEDALQETMLRAWKGMSKFEGRSSLRSWLYTIATNTCLNAIERRPKRVLPIDYGPATDPHDGPGNPVVEEVWIEPYPDEKLGVEDGPAGPEARYEQREAVELAFIAALQTLPANQRAVLILREVLGYSAKEVATSLDTSVASVNSALQRARKTVEEKTPDQSQQATLRQLGEDGVKKLVEDYVEAWQRGDVDEVVSLLAADASFSMPPMSTWYRGREGIATWMRRSPLSGDFKWKPILTQANGQPTLAYYSWDPEENAYVPFALNVLTFDERGEIEDVTAFIVRSSQDPDPEVQAQTPYQPADYEKLAGMYGRFGLPARLD